MHPQSTHSLPMSQMLDACIGTIWVLFSWHVPMHGQSMGAFVQIWASHGQCMGVRVGAAKVLVGGNHFLRVVA